MPSPDCGRNGWMCQVGMPTATQASTTTAASSSQIVRGRSADRDQPGPVVDDVVRAHGAIQSETATRRPCRISQMKPARWA